MNELANHAQELMERLRADRRYLHRHPELGTELPQTSTYVEKCLRKLGYEVTRFGSSGLSVMAGDPSRGPVILLRGDMDALPMKEESGLEFASNRAAAHCCGHDLHTAMLLGAAALLKEREADLKGCVKFMFQPGEETGNGAREMIEEGILENPKPDAVLALHVNAKAPAGRISYGRGCTFASNDSLRIEVKGQGGHGARPHESIDPVYIATRIYEALQSVRLNQINPMEPVILTITSINGGSSHNIIPNDALMLGTLRTYSASVREKAIKRIRELTEGTAALYGGSAKAEFLQSLPPMYCSPAFTDEMLRYAAEAVGSERIEPEPEIKMGSEDFAYVTERYPESCGYLFLGAGPDEKNGYPYGQHNAKVVFNEEVMPLGSAVMAQCALRWLEEHSGENRHE